MPDPHRPADDEARATARALLAASAHGALGTLADGAPMVTRAAVLWREVEGLGMLLSDLSDHAVALRADPACSVLLGDVPPRGDPLTHARLTLRGRAEVADKAEWRGAWLAARPKAGLYYDFTDFAVWRLRVAEALLVAGFGRAHRLEPSDLAPGMKRPPRGTGAADVRE